MPTMNKYNISSNYLSMFHTFIHNHNQLSGIFFFKSSLFKTSQEKAFLLILTMFLIWLLDISFNRRNVLMLQSDQKSLGQTPDPVKEIYKFHTFVSVVLIYLTIDRAKHSFVWPPFHRNTIYTVSVYSNWHTKTRIGIINFLS